MSFRGRVVNIVVQAESGKDRGIVFSAKGIHVCASPAEVGSWCMRISRDEEEPTVSLGVPGGRLLPRLNQIADSIESSDGPFAGRGQGADRGERTAVLLVVMVEPPADPGVEDFETARAMVWPAKSQPRICVGEVELGAVVLELARDDREPRVFAGPPPDAGAELLDRGLGLLVNYLKS